MWDLKAISPDAIPEALSKAERYRLLHEAADAESICQDVLRIDPENQQALITLLLAITDQFDDHVPASRALDLIPRLQGEYERAYYEGVICERAAKSQLRQVRFGAGAMVYDGLLRAMSLYESAAKVRPAANDDALLRWNACARFLMANPQLSPAEDPAPEPILSE
jgi:hypothetical protein